MNLACSFGKLLISGHDNTPWELSCSVKDGGDVEEIHVCLESKQAAVLPELTINWHMPLDDISMRWTAFHSTDQWLLPPVWAKELTSSLAYGMPLISFLNPEGLNRITVAFSDAVRPVKIKAGIFEEVPDVEFDFRLFTSPEAPCNHFSAVFRIDKRQISYSDAISDASRWFAGFSEYQPALVPEEAADPVFSTWYNYHQNLFANEIERECCSAIKYGLKTIIVDDGWQTDDNQKKYSFCGDWQISKKRFPNMKQHVGKIHSLGMKYILWYSIPFLGSKSRAVAEFADKTLIFAESMDAYVLDPRFPEVREYLISIYENAVKEWDIDGFKFDFIDSFQFYCQDPALKDNYAGRDIQSLPDAVNRLLDDAITRLKRLKTNILIEFRQSYIGPAIRKYGNIIRVSDCPCDFLSNRIGMVKLRLTSGNTRVHSDMITWDQNTSPESAALQLLNVFFSVPQISVKFDEIPLSQKQMLENYLGFWSDHKEVLLKGRFIPIGPEANYPVISAENKNEKITVTFSHKQVMSLNNISQPLYVIINATLDNCLILDSRENTAVIESYNVLGEKQTLNKNIVDHEIIEVPVPPAGRLEVKFES